MSGCMGLAIILIGGWFLNLATYLYLRKLFMLYDGTRRFEMLQWTARFLGVLPYFFFFYWVICALTVILTQEDEQDGDAGKDPRDLP